LFGLALKNLTEPFVLQYSKEEGFKMFDEIKWLFFDMGSTLIDETESYKGWFQNASDAVGGAISPKEIERGYLEGMARYAATVTGQLKPYGYDKPTAAGLYPSELDTAYPQVKPLLERLSRRYKLAVIANQSLGADERLERYGILQYFDFILNSAVIGLQKPDPRIFQLALEKADCEPREAVMIGDRPDNDIYPAKQLGLRTIRIRQGSASCQQPRSEAYEADATVDTLDGLNAIFPD
jgi:HAD superfamily hydrolase (TIGR01549 family)